MKGKLLAEASVAFGVLMLVLSLYQANQYWTTQPAVKQYLKSIEALGTQGDAGAAGANEITEAKKMITETSSIYLQAALADFVLGLVFLVLGVVYYPAEARQ